MGEITDALRRAERERGSRPREEGAQPGRPPEARPALRPDPELRPELPAARGPVVEISREKLPPWAARALLVADQHLVGEHFRQFALRVEAELARLGRRSVLLTSPIAQEGKTLSACNLALALASMAGERRIALVDLDLRRPAVARNLGFQPSVGIEQVLSGEKPLAEARAATDVPHLDIFPVRSHGQRVHEQLATRSLGQVLAQLENAYHTVVIDTPPGLLFPDIGLILPHVGACIAVVRSGATLRKAFRELAQLLPPEKLIGCFLNEVRLPRHTRRYETYYGYADDEDPGEAAK